VSQLVQNDCGRRNEDARKSNRLLLGQGVNVLRPVPRGADGALPPNPPLVRCLAALNSREYLGSHLTMDISTPYLLSIPLRHPLQNTDALDALDAGEVENLLAFYGIAAGNVPENHRLLLRNYLAGSEVTSAWLGCLDLDACTWCRVEWNRQLLRIDGITVLFYQGRERVMK
jgi:hypothetical protein